jgi:hypothetical protein
MAVLGEWSDLLERGSLDEGRADSGSRRAVFYLQPISVHEWIASFAKHIISSSPHFPRRAVRFFIGAS